MRKLLMTATMLTMIGFAGSTAFADGYNGHGSGYGSAHNGSGYDGNYGDGSGGEQGSGDQSFGGGGYGDSSSGRGYDARNNGGEQGVDRYEERRDRDWERSWRRWDNYRDHDQVLPYWKLERRIERQGYFNVRNLRQSRFGFGWKAFAQDRFRRPVVLRVNPFDGRVLDVRVIYWR